MTVTLHYSPLASWRIFHYSQLPLTDIWQKSISDRFGEGRGSATSTRRCKGKKEEWEDTKGEKPEEGGKQAGTLGGSKTTEKGKEK